MLPLWLLVIGAPAQAQSHPGTELLVRNAPPHGIVVAHVDLTSKLQGSQAGPVVPEAVRATAGGQPVPVQFVPDPDFDGQHHIAGTVVLQWSGGADGRIRLTFDGTPPQPAAWDGKAHIKQVVITHDAHRIGGLPSRIVFSTTGKTLESLNWEDQVYQRERGSFFLKQDPQPKVDRVSEGPLCTVVRVKARYMQPDGKRPPSEPEAIYDWYYLHSLPFVWVNAMMRQREAFAWNQHHALQLSFPRDELHQWAGGEALQEGQFTASQMLSRFPSWGAVLDGRNAIAILDSGQVLLYDAGTSQGAYTYLHAHNEWAWDEWRDKELRFSAWLWIGTDDKPVAALRGMMHQLPTSADVTVTQSMAQTP